jgi:hypothetical protein
LSEPDYDRIRTEWLEQLAKSGRAYSNEVKSMAKEILERRAKDVKPPEPQQYDWAMYVP